MLTAIAAWTVIELVFFVALLIALAITTSLDRAGSTSPKFWVAFAGFSIFLIYQIFLVEDSQINTWEYWKSIDPYVAIGHYILVGFGYAIVEAVSELFERKRRLAAAWRVFIGTADDNIKAYIKGELNEGDDDNNTGKFYNAQRGVRRFCEENRSQYSFMDVTVNLNREESRVPEPRINQNYLSDCMFAWTFFWPGYLLSLVFGRLIDTLWDFALNFFSGLLQRITNILFRNTFKL